MRPPEANSTAIAQIYSILLTDKLIYRFSSFCFVPQIMGDYPQTKSLLELLELALCPGLQLIVSSYCPFGKRYVAS